MPHPTHKLEWQRTWDAECARREAEATQGSTQWLDGPALLQELKARVLSPNPEAHNPG